MNKLLLNINIQKPQIKKEKPKNNNNKENINKSINNKDNIKINKNIAFLNSNNTLLLKTQNTTNTNLLQMKVLQIKLTMKFNERVKYYVGDLINTNNNKINLENYSDSVIINSEKELDITNLLYDEPLKNLLVKTKQLNKRFSFIRADIYNILSPSFCKVRNSNNYGTILRCLNFGRHWHLYYNKPQDKPFSSKINHIFWRGTTTGFIDSNISNRFILMEKWFDKHPHINIGFCTIKQENFEYKKYLKGRVKPHKFLDYKYILSVNGNDKDSGLNWKLNSNSVVLMTAPKISSWLMESKLIPDYHYVLLKDDFSNLEEKLNWCNNNQNKCIEIIKNANKYMQQFYNQTYEEQIEIAVINEYFKKII